MPEYVPCVLVREVDSSQWSFGITVLGEGVYQMESRPVYVETLIPVEMSEFVKLAQGKKTLLPGPFRLPQVPEWANKWFDRNKKA